MDLKQIYLTNVQEQKLQGVTKMKYYLAKSGNVTGPYLEDDIQKFEKTGEIFTYSWIWREGQEAWKAVDPAPTVNPEKEAKKASPETVGSGDAYCLWGSDIFKGAILSKTAVGVEFSYSDESLTPPFTEGLGITLVSTDLDTQESLAHNMKIVEIQREEKAWKLFLRHNNY